MDYPPPPHKADSLLHASLENAINGRRVLFIRRWQNRQQIYDLIHECVLIANLHKIVDYRVYKTQNKIVFPSNGYIHFVSNQYEGRGIPNLLRIEDL